MVDIAFACNCGKLRGELTGVGGGQGTHALCYCSSCRSAEIVLGQPDPHPAPVSLYLTTPDHIRINAGAEHLAVLRISDKTKTYRWYAACCGAPLAITGDSPGFPFASVAVGRLADAAELGPVQCKAFLPKAGGGTRHTNVARFAWGMLSRSVIARLSGRWKDTPFFDVVTKAPNGPIRLLSSQERAALPLKP